MKKWQYGLAYYTGGLITAHGEYMSDVDQTSQSIAHFLQEAGEKGWEMCCLLPGVADEKTNMCLVFKRPR